MIALLVNTISLLSAARTKNICTTPSSKYLNKDIKRCSRKEIRKRILEGI